MIGWPDARPIPTLRSKNSSPSPMKTKMLPISTNYYATVVLLRVKLQKATLLKAKMEKSSSPKVTALFS